MTKSDGLLGGELLRVDRAGVFFWPRESVTRPSKAHKSGRDTYNTCWGFLPLVDAQLAPTRKLRSAVTLLLCLLVFFFALHAKLAVYNGSAGAKATPSTASKLWAGGQKLEDRAHRYDSTPLLVFAVVWLCALCLRRECHVASPVVVPAADSLRRWHLHRFLRPPPFLS